jgi:hypothetical protein
MSRTDLNKVIRLLPSLTATERREVVARAMVLGTVAASSDSMELVRMTASAGANRFPPVSVIMNSKAAVRYKQGCEELDRFMDQLGCTGRARRQATVRLTDIVIIYLRRHNIPVSPATVGDTMSRIHEVVDTELPCYIASGLLRRVLEGQR